MENDIKDIFKEKLPENELNFKKLVEKIISKISEYDPYDLISQFVQYLKYNSIIKFEEHNDYDETKLKFCYETIQVLSTCIEEKDYKKQTLDEEELYNIINMLDELFSLKECINMAITINSNDVREEAEYKFDNALYLNVTGKRYDIFEINHQREVLKPLEKYIFKTYNVEVNDILKAIESLKHKFNFGLQDTFDELKELIDSNTEVEPSEDLAERLNGLYDHNISKITKLPKTLLDIYTTKLGDNSDFITNINFYSFLNLFNSLNSKPIIKIGEDYYCFAIYRLLDIFDRYLIKSLYLKNEDIKQEIIRCHTKSIEDYVVKLFKSILQFGTFYQNNHFKIGKNFNENDILIEYDEYLFIIEVKAGSFTPDVAFDNIESHKESLNNLVNIASKQIEKLYNLIENGNVKIYSDDKNDADVKLIIDKSKYKKIFKVIITFESFNEIASRAEKIKLINIGKETVVLSIDDLEVYSDYFKSLPINFINYWGIRTEATKSKSLFVNDELDHLGLYIDYKYYPEYLKNNKEFKNIDMFCFEMPREEIDNYYNGKYKNQNIEKPLLKYPQYVSMMIDYINNNYQEKTSFPINALMNLNENDLKQINNCLEQSRDFYEKNSRPKYLGVILDNQLINFVCIADGKTIPKELIEQLYANMVIRNFEEMYYIIVYYKDDFISKIETQILSTNDGNYTKDELINLVDKWKNFKLTKRKNESGKIGRNEKCPCGSGLKYKRCCGK